MDHTCAIRTSKSLQCWGNDYKEALPRPESTIILEQGLLRLRVDNYLEQVLRSDSDKYFVVTDLNSGAILCKSNADICTLPNSKITNKSRIGVKVINVYGTSPIETLNFGKVCPSPELQQLETSTSTNQPGSGELIDIAVSISKLCNSKPSSIWIRERGQGAEWGKWVKAAVGPTNVLTLRKSFLKTSELEFLAYTNTGESRTALIPLTVSRGNIDFTISAKPKKIAGGFNQGGLVTVKILAAPGYEGFCEIIANNASASNFASVPMNDFEQQSLTLKVSKGQAQGNLSFRWNGMVQANISCSSVNFPDEDFYSDTKVLNLSPNY
jgi:hypothetical protein